MYVGTVTRVVLNRGFGFIHCADLGSDVFVHAEALDDSLEFDEQLQERRVAFDVTQAAKGLRATNVRVAE